ncbi:MAG: mannose-6-phosphate isomerase, class I [Propionibacteriaceae bacterium]|jgi:mannose-6-phosphate isomerase|nr:mannose-6-phosphate isomerase, class I [Propionibacteriaceae bacterium]
MLALTGQIRDYAWGSPTAIPALLGAEPTGEPQAEYWLGAHPLAPSTVNDVDLGTVLQDHPEWIGDRTYRAFGDRFPLLLKLLAAERPLSLQAHPNREQAEAGFARENQARIALDSPVRVYHDDWPKPELLVALTPFDALCGFRNPHHTLALFEALGLGADLSSVIGPLGSRRGSAAFAEVFLDILSQDHPEYVNEVLHEAHRHRDDDSEVGEFARTALDLDVYFPHQPSILAALLLNRVHLEPGQGMYLAPCTLHAYLHGVGVEVMASSDNVLRGGLTAKHIDVDELIQVVAFEASEPVIVPTESDAGFVRYITPTPEFALWRGDLTSKAVAIPRTDSCRIGLVIDGEAQLRQGESVVDLTPGQAVLMPFGEEVTASGSATLFVASPGV